MSLKEKVEEVEKLIKEWEYEIYNGWNSNTIKFFLDSLSNFLVWHKENGEAANKENKEIMSKTKTNKLYRNRKDILFSNLSKKDKNNLFGDSAGEE